MEFEGDLLDSLTFEETSDGIKIGWFGDQAPKADGHNNFSGKSSLPVRQTLPRVGEQFRPSIHREIEKIVADAVADEIQIEKADFENVTTKIELYDVLRDYFPDLTRSEMKLAISRTPTFARFLDDLDLLGLL